MSKNYNMLLAGFGGQGILFAGKVIAYGGLMDEKEISWLPSYGPEMRGGTANCSVCISDTPVGSPLVLTPNVLVAMNLPSLDKFIGSVEPGGTVIIDSFLIDKKSNAMMWTFFMSPRQGSRRKTGSRGLRILSLSASCLRKPHSARTRRSTGQSRRACRRARRICSTRTGKPSGLAWNTRADPYILQR